MKSFFDRYGAHSLEWGVEWRKLISTTISGTTFFIPVISPSYLKSANCRDEFEQFWTKASNSILGELLLPILWVRVYPDRDEEEEIWKVAQERQYVDWTEIRKKDENSPEYKGLIDEMGERLAKAARESPGSRRLYLIRLPRLSSTRVVAPRSNRLPAKRNPVCSMSMPRLRIGKSSRHQSTGGPNGA